MKKSLFLTVVGTMGSGKTTVARVIAERLKMELVTENFADNAFLARFYKNMQRWAFHSQTFYLTEKIGQLVKIGDTIASLRHDIAGVVQDTPIEQDVFSYAKTLFLQGNLLPEEYRLYRRIYHLSAKKLPRPNFYVWLETDLVQLAERIERRRRPYEKKIPLSYLGKLDKTNRQWLTSIPAGKKIIIDTNHKDFSRDKNAQAWLVEKVKELFGS